MTEYVELRHVGTLFKIENVIHFLKRNHFIDKKISTKEERKYFFRKKTSRRNKEPKHESALSSIEEGSMQNNDVPCIKLQEMKTEDDAILENVKMRSEDFNIIRKTTNSRLSVYETRLDTMEQMMFEMDEKVKSQSLLQFSPTSTTKFNIRTSLNS